LEQVNANFDDEVSVTYGVCIEQKGSTPTIENSLFHLSDVAVLNAANRAKDWTLPLTDGLSPSTEYNYVAYYIDYYGKVVYTQVVDFVTTKPEVCICTVNGVSFNMAGVEGGTFMMGATSEQTGAYSDEKPVHFVTLSDYYIGETEVTQELWIAVMGTNPSSFTGNTRPVEQVSWDDCRTFISKLNALTGENFRLPTEAQWEFAARGGNKSRGNLYSGGNSLGDVVWYYENSGNKTHAVKTKSPNELGLYDMSGNVWEWCRDWYGGYSSAAVTNPTGPASRTYCVNRGGCWNSDASNCRAANRYIYAPGARFSTLGFRLAR
jgi:formylglycine-generating enzyme required for sulfatase activity